MFITELFLKWGRFAFSNRVCVIFACLFSYILCVTTDVPLDGVDWGWSHVSSLLWPDSGPCAITTGIWDEPLVSLESAPSTGLGDVLSMGTGDRPSISMEDMPSVGIGDVPSMGMEESSPADVCFGIRLTLAAFGLCELWKGLKGMRFVNGPLPKSSTSASLGNLYPKKFWT